MQLLFTIFPNSASSDSSQEPMSDHPMESDFGSSRPLEPSDPYQELSLTDTNISSDDEDDNDRTSRSSTGDEFSGAEHVETVRTAVTSASVEDGLIFNMKNWALKHSVSHAALSELLSYLRDIVPNLPKDARTLLGTARESVPLITMGCGDFIYFGFDKAFHLLRDAETNSFQLCLNIDGLPLFKSTNVSFWPILGRFMHTSTLFIVGCFCGTSKPPVNEYLESLIRDLKRFNGGFEFEGRKITIKLAFVCMDTPAKAHFKCIKAFNGYFGCDQCSQKGHWRSRVVFSDTSFGLRTDESFRQQIQEEHHNGTSPFVEISYIDMIHHFPSDYMHVVCLGSTRKLLNIFLRGPLPLRKPAAIIDEMSKMICYLRPFISCDFLRRGRTLREIDCWKASEFRLFLLYTGVIVFHDTLSEDQYQNFLKLFCAI